MRKMDIERHERGSRLKKVPLAKLLPSFIRRINAVSLFGLIYHFGRKLSYGVRNEPGVSRRQPRQEIDGLNVDFVCRVHIFGSTFRPVGFEN